VVARRSDPVKPLRQAWRWRARVYHRGHRRFPSDGVVLAWQGRVVVPPYGSPRAEDHGVILDRDGAELEQLPALPAHSRMSLPVGPVITWPDEGLVAGMVDTRTFDLSWIDLDGASHVVPTELGAGAQEDWQLTPSNDGGVFVSVAIADTNYANLGWTIDPRLDAVYGHIRCAPFPDHEYRSEYVTRAGSRWLADGRVAAVADDVVVLDEGSGASRHIVARRLADGGELWRRPAVDAFVLGTLPMPAWSDDRVYVVDRGARRAQAWAQETESANIHGLDAERPMRTMLTVGAVAAARQGVVTAPSILSCLSTRTGDPLWTLAVAGDIVSFHCHTTWAAFVVAGEEKLHVVRHDGTPVGDGGIVAQIGGESWWPPHPTLWPCIVGGDEEHVIVVENQPRRLSARRCARPGDIVWETPLPSSVVYAPQAARYFRLINRAPVALTADAAYVRSGKHVYGFLA
jgi:hypothetical protein